jgi:prepilin-type N-terminal cleavage/methylation domain-containing protein
MSHDNTKGFTLIELMLAMTFIAVLLVAIALTTIQISNIYTKGITLREVNQVGRSVSEELQRNIASSVPFDVTPKMDNSMTSTSKYVVRGGGGRLCLGRYTYAWNYGSALRGGAGAPGIYNEYANVEGSKDEQDIRFVKVEDASAALCTNPELDIDSTKANDLLTSGDRDLVMHKFSITQTAKDDEIGQALYAISMTIGTNDREQLTTNDASCKPPSEGVGDEDYCSVNQFDIIARAGNKSGGGQ